MPDQQWAELVAAIDASEDPDGLCELGQSLLAFWELEDWRPQLREHARRNPKIATALHSASHARERTVADIIGWEQVIPTWCRFYDQHDPWDQWAEQLLISLMPPFPSRQALPTDEAWQLVLGLLKAAPNEKVLGIVGACPLENLLSSDPQHVAHLIELEADRNHRLRRALVHVWRYRTRDDVFERVKRLAEPANGH